MTPAATASRELVRRAALALLYPARLLAAQRTAGAVVRPAAMRHIGPSA